MADYLRIFATQADYDAYIAGGYPKPNVSYIEATDETIFTNYADSEGPDEVLASVKVADFTGTTFNAANQYITEVFIPDGVTSIAQQAFTNCAALTSVAIPSGVTSIGTYAFNSCSALTSLTIPNSVTSIGSGAFNRCTSLTTTSFWPGSVSTVAVSTFNGCSSLSNVVLPEGVTTIEYSSRSDSGAFTGCSSILTVDLPSTITTIGGYAFYNCNSITSYTIRATTPPTLVGSSQFYGVNNFVIYVPAESVETYKAASGWSTYASRIQAIH